ncbi:hypothetical protein [Rhizobacter sp. Root1221]|uniref:hypothetical protein n=1 Tax=Rhizobacter sp. Root1221 TaxID=1736433 RepID=UPI000B0CA00B|nr:hypothetical protein [Rhizobacter sp. Root1221]
MNSFSKFAVHCALIATSLLLAGCQKKPEVRYSETLARNALMALPFPDWAPTGSAQVQAVSLYPTTDVPSEAAAAVVHVEVSPVYVVRLDDTHAALVTQVLPVDENNRPYDGHAHSGMIGAYFFEHSAAGWRMTDRQDFVTTSGVGGNIGTTGITKLGEGHFAVTAQWGSCWQGYCGRWLVVVGLQGNEATLLNSGIALSVDNDGARGACSALSGGDPRAAKEADAEKHECLDIQSKWKFQGNRLLVSYEGRLSKLGENGELLPTRKIQEQAIYEATPGKLTLISGRNPVPDFFSNGPP